ncbi:MAG: MBL fold metallo-hydrolase [Microbacter sp.]
MHIETFVFNPFMENTYLVYDDSSACVVIDAGCLTEIERHRLRETIDKHQLKLEHVLNTHLHLDHAFGNGFLFETYHLAPEAHRDDEFLLSQMHAQAALFGVPFHESVQPIGKYLEDHDRILFGNTSLEVIHVPGHSPGSLCFYSKEDQTVFVGDVLFRGSIGRTDLPKGNYEQLIQGIQDRLLTLPDETKVFSGHGSFTTIGFERKENPYL